MQKIIVVYGDHEGSQESREAADFLRKAGFGNILELKDGFKGWLSAGNPAE